MPGAVKTVEAQIHVKEHQLITKLLATGDDQSFAMPPPPPPATKGAKKDERKSESEKASAD